MTWEGIIFTTLIGILLLPVVVLTFIIAIEWGVDVYVKCIERLRELRKGGRRIDPSVR